MLKMTVLIAAQLQEIVTNIQFLSRYFKKYVKIGRKKSTNPNFFGNKYSLSK